MDALFLLIRNDMDSMTLGRSCAMASHITDHFRNEILNNPGATKEIQNFIIDRVRDWTLTTNQGFGTVYVMGITGEALFGITDEILRFITEASFKYDVEEPLLALGMYNTGVTTDPEYHVIDGTTTHLLPVDVGGYIFGDSEKIMNYLRSRGISFL